MAFPSDPLDVLVEVALDADVTADPVFWIWTDATDWVYVRNLLTITQGRSDRASTVQPSTLRATVDNTGGRWVARNPTGPWYGGIRRGTPIQVTVEGEVRFAGYIDELPVRWDPTGNDPHVELSASGILQRLGRGLAPARSSAYRAFTSPDYSQPVAYWPMEDEAGTSLASAIPGAERMQFTDLTLATDDSFAGSKNLPELAPTGRIAWIVPTYTHSGEWRVRWLFRLDAAPPGDSDLMGWYCPGATIPHWVLRLTSAGVMTLRGYNASFAEVLGDGGVNISPLLGPLAVSVQAVQNGADVDWAWTVHDDTGSYGNSGTETSATIAAIRSGGLTNGSNLGDIVIGHVAIYDDTAAAPDSLAAFGWPDQTAVNAIAGIASDARIPVVTTEGPAGSVSLLGPQPFGDDLFMMRDAEQADGGVLYEDGFGLVYLARYERYNRDVDLALDQAPRHLTDMIPTDDEQGVVNEIEVSRVGGSSATAMDAAHIARHGRSATSISVNINSDADLADRAQWEVHLGTVEDLRVPQLMLNLARNPELIADWQACHVGSRITVDNAFPEMPPDTIDLHLEGWTEVLGPFSWDVTANCSPARPWQVLEVEGSGNSGRLDTGGSELAIGVGSTTSPLYLTNTGDLPASTTAEPYDIGVGGERITVTAMTTPGAVFIAAGTVAHGDNAAVSPGLPAGITPDVGQLLVCIAAIRNSGTGTPNIPDGWERLNVFGLLDNVDVFVKYYVTGDAAPTVSFIDGVAGATTSARIIAFSGVSKRLQYGATQLNASADPIAYPALPVQYNNCLVLIVGWKQDDHTGVNAVGGFTEAFDSFTTTGNDQSLFCQYQVQTTAANIAAGSVTATGGVSAISRSAVLALRPLQQATATRSVNGVEKSHSSGDAVSLWQPNVIAL